MKLSHVAAVLVISATHVVAVAANSVSCVTDNHSSLAFEFDATSGTFFDEGISNGDQFGWYNHTIFDAEQGNNMVGLNSGICTVISEAAENSTTTQKTEYLCSQYNEFTADPFVGSTDEFTADPFVGSTALVEGIYHRGDGQANFTIAGGSGCFAGISGYVNWLELSNGTRFRETWYLQPPPPTTTSGGSAATAGTTIPHRALLTAAFLYLVFAE